jgi:hypothetical protein
MREPITWEGAIKDWLCVKPNMRTYIFSWRGPGPMASSVPITEISREAAISEFISRYPDHEAFKDLSVAVV